MRTFRLCFAPAAVACAVFFACTGSAFAAAAKKPAPPPDMRKMIQSVNVADSTVVIVYNVNKQTHTYKVDDMTALKVNGATGKFADIKKGMEVADYSERDNDDLDSLTLTGDGEQPKPAAKATTKPKPKTTSTSTTPSSTP